MFPCKRELVMVLAGTVPSVIHRRPFVMANSKIPLQKRTILLHFWGCNAGREVDRGTAIDVYQWPREICSSSLIHKPQIVLGGPGIVVQIDENLFRHKPKMCPCIY